MMVVALAASRRVVETLQERGLTASFVGLKSADHAMLRRAGTWDHLVGGYLAGTLRTQSDLSRRRSSTSWAPRPAKRASSPLSDGSLCRDALVTHLA